MIRITKPKYDFRRRVLGLGVVIGLVYGVMAVRAVDLMVVKGPELREMARRQHQRVEKLTPRRGSILDANGTVLAESVPVDSVYAHPRMIPDPAAAAAALSKILGIKEMRLLEKLASKRSFTWIKRAVDPGQARMIRRNDIPGVVVVGEYARYYPQGKLAANLLGFVGSDGVGLEGLEKKYDDILSGTERRFIVQSDAMGKLLYPTPDALPKPKGGDRLVLTLDARVQSIVEEALDEALATSKAESGMAAVMESGTGEMLALAVRPTFNPNRFWDYPQESFRDRFVTDIFEPGSTFKVFTLAAFLDSGEGDIYEELYCEDGMFELDGHIINDTHPHGWFTVEEIVVHSSNIGAAKMGLGIGRDLLERYVRSFGFGSATGLGLPGESRGLMRSFSALSRVGLANVSFGQGIGVTGAQLLTAVNAIASGGKLIKPHIIKRVENAEGNVVWEARSGVARRILSEDTVRDVTHVMVNVVHGGGTGERAAPEGYTVAGKTGTAQKVNLETGGYYGDKYVASFMGWAPAEDPEISVLVVVDNPKGKPWGGSVAAPAFREIVERTLPLRGVLPDELYSDARTFTTVASAGLPASNTQFFGYEKTSSENKQERRCSECMPDLLGMSLRNVLKMAANYGVSVQVVGSGRTVDQWPSPGEPLDGVKKWRVELATGPN